MARTLTPRPWLHELRERSGMTATQVACEAGITREALRLLETGQRSPSLPVAFALGDLLGFDPRRFLESA